MHKGKEKDLPHICLLCGKHTLNVSPRGKKRNNAEIFSILKLVLPKVEFNALNDKRKSSDPVVCTSCFKGVKTIPERVLKLEKLVGSPLNLRLYKPGREAWIALKDMQTTETICPSPLAVNRSSHDESVAKEKSMYPNPVTETSLNICGPSSVNIASSDVASTNISSTACKEGSKYLPLWQSDGFQNTEDGQGQPMSELNDAADIMTRPSSKWGKGNKLMSSNKQIKRGKRLKARSNIKSDHPETKQHRFKSLAQNSQGEWELHKVNTKFNIETNERVHSLNSKYADRKRTRKTRQSERLTKFSIKAKNQTEMNEAKPVEVNLFITSDHVKLQREEKSAVSVKSAKSKDVTLSKEHDQHDVQSQMGIFKSSDRPTKYNSTLKPQICNPSLNAKDAMEDFLKTSRLSTQMAVLDNQKSQNASSSETVTTLKDSSKDNRCELCGKNYVTQTGLTRHKKKEHGVQRPDGHCCPYPGCGQHFTKKEKLEIHLCEHSPERRLFCEKCGQTFGCRRYLDVHLKMHKKKEEHATNPPTRSIQCEEIGCHKLFTTRENMKCHVLNQHRGRKPQSLPGVYFPCSFPGCDKKFTFRSTLYRHNKLVHKGGDYRLGGEIVKYPCTYDGCTQVFNRKNLLEEHQVMEHDKLSVSRLRPMRSRELDFTESICCQCGMVLTKPLLPRHVKLYHGSNTEDDLNENKSYPCHLDGCHEIFNTQTDRASHVQIHVANPLFTCQVAGCTKTFYLEKNLDSHLWGHAKKASKCDFEGCSEMFVDQIELAKHSKVHYNGKMRCPWPKCDNWMTETGQLKPHFAAHSRSLQTCNETDFACEVCDLPFSSRWGLMIHKRTHGEEVAAAVGPLKDTKRKSLFSHRRMIVKSTTLRQGKFSCEEQGCPAIFCDQKGFFDHFLYHHTQQSCYCSIDGCSQSFSSLLALSKHTKIHFDGKLQCSWRDCKKLFASPFIVKRHLYRHIVARSRRSRFNHNATSTADIIFNQNEHGQEQQDCENKTLGWPLSCSQCFMVFRLQSNLESHMEYHNKPEYVCPICGKKGRHSHVKPPVETKVSKKTYHCDQCSACYATISGLKFHLLQKHKIGKWPFSCAYCGKGFVSSREMQRHLPSHTKEKPFVCDLCGASFASHTGHRAHMRKHTGQKYACEMEGCGKVYTTSVSLRGHMAQHEGFVKRCTHCGKNYHNPYSHKCKAAREGKKKQSDDSNYEQASNGLPQQQYQNEDQPHQKQQPQQLQLQQQQQLKSVSETPTFHLLQPSGHQFQVLHQPYHHHQQQHAQQPHQQQQIHHIPQQLHQQQLQPQQQQYQFHYILSGGMSMSETERSNSSSVQGQGPAESISSPLSSSLTQQQPPMIVMAPHLLTSQSGNTISRGDSNVALMTLPYNNQQHPFSHRQLFNSIQPPQPPPTVISHLIPSSSSIPFNHMLHQDSNNLTRAMPEVQQLPHPHLTSNDVTSTNNISNLQQQSGDPDMTLASQSNSGQQSFSYDNVILWNRQNI